MIQIDEHIFRVETTNQLEFGQIGEKNAPVLMFVSEANLQSSKLLLKAKPVQAEVRKREGEITRNR